MFIFQATSLQDGVVIAGFGNGSSGTTLDGLNQPFSLDIHSDNIIYISEMGNERIIRINLNSSVKTLVAGTGSTGSSNQQLHAPTTVKVDIASNVYVAEYSNHRVMLWTSNSSTGRIVAGNGTAGSTNSQLNVTAGLAIDSSGNLYVSDRYNHRIMKWAPNSTFVIIIAGTGTNGLGSHQLSSPFGIHLIEEEALLYVTDMVNHRIQRFYLNGTMNAVTVAGGNGPESRSNQLISPHAVYVSRTTHDVYVSDSGNHRIQLWRQGASFGVTLVGVTGETGTSLSHLQFPTCAILNENETFLYFCDRLNHRILRFTLI